MTSGALPVSSSSIQTVTSFSSQATAASVDSGNAGPALLIQTLFVAYYGRPASVYELANWTESLSNPDAGGLEWMGDAFAWSDEFMARTAGKDSAVMVEYLFQQLYGRAADDAASALWVHALDEGYLTASQLVFDLTVGAVGADKVALDNKITAATAFTSTLADTLPGYHIENPQAGVDYLASVTGAASLAAALTALPQLADELAGMAPNTSTVRAVHVEGTFAVGATLHAVPELVDADGVTAVAYQWYVGGRSVEGATGASLTLAEAHGGQPVSVAVTYIDGRGVAGSAYSGLAGDVPMSLAARSVESVFVTLLGRPAGADVLLEWVARINGGETGVLDKLRSALADSAEFAAQYEGMSHEQAVDAVFQALFGRAADSEGRTFYSQHLQQGTLDIAGVAEIAAEGAQGADRLALDSKIAAAAAFTGAISGDSWTYRGTEAFDIARGYLASVTDSASAADAAANVETTLEALYALAPNNWPNYSLTYRGDFAVGNTITVTEVEPGDADGVGALSYQWTSGGVPIPGAVGMSLVVTEAMVGKDLAFVVSYTDGRGAAETIVITIDQRQHHYGTEGADTFAGGAGNDVYTIDHAGDAIVELANGGRDSATVLSAPSGTYALADNVEDAYLGNPALVGLTGNGLDNNLHGNTAANVLAGHGGEDTLWGSSGNDTLLGGEGDDVLWPEDGSDTVDRARDVVDGGGGWDVVHFGGMQPRYFADYEIAGRTAAGIVLRHTPTGDVVTLRNVEQVQFFDGIKTINEVLLLMPASSNNAPVGDVAIEGTIERGATLTAVPSLEDADGRGDFSFQWHANGQPIAGATSATLVLTGAQVAAAISVVVSYTDGKGNLEVVASEATAPVALPAVERAVELAYVEYLGRPADPANLAHWTGVIGKSGMEDGVAALRKALVASAEFAGLYDGTPEQNVTQIFHLLFGREPDQAGFDWWTLKLSTGQMTVADVVAVFATSLEFTMGIRDSKIAAASALTAALDTIEEQSAYASQQAREIVRDMLAGVTNGTSLAAAVAAVEQTVAAIVALQSGPDNLEGTAGQDTLVGGKGNDSYHVNLPGDVIVEHAGGGTDYVYVEFTAKGTYVLSDNVENVLVKSPASVAVNIVGNASDNILFGNGAANSLSGGDGNDYLNGGAGKDTMAGGAGNDSYSVDVAGDVVTEAVGGGTDRVSTSLASYTLGANVDNLAYNGDKAFTGTGNADNNDIRGDAGNDKLTGNAGADTLEGNAGNDTLLGGDGDDTLVVGVRDEDDNFVVGTGTDVADGGSGNDTVVVAGNVDDYERSRPNATDTVLKHRTSGETIVLRGVESVVFGEFGNVATPIADLWDNIASDANDNLHGTEDADDIDGGLGNDTMAGGTGDDRYTVDVAGDEVREETGGGTDPVDVAFTAKGSYTLGANVENATVTAAKGVAVNVTGNDGKNIMVGNGAANLLDGAGGNDTLDGGAGKDTLVGGAGRDYYVVDTGDVVVETDDGGTDTVATALAAYTLASGVEYLVYTGTKAFTGNGNALDNLLVGGGGNDKLAGLAGDDFLDGDEGDDLLAGGDGNDDLYSTLGNDTADGGAGHDRAYIAGSLDDYERSRPNANDTVLVHKTSKASITLRGIEEVVGDDETSWTIDEVQLNIVSVGDDILVGGDTDDRLDGGAGSDRLSGGAGNDRYLVDVVGDTVTEQNNEGIDTVEVGFKVPGTYTLGDNVEHAIITGKPAIGLTGNALANALTGNAAANVLDGGAGNDTLDGGTGKDVLRGGAGDDEYVVDNAADKVEELAGEGIDTVKTAMVTLTLAANAENLRYTGTKAFTGNGNGGDNEVTGAAGADKLSGLAGNDTLAGNGGNDLLQGGDGDDWLDAGTGLDTVDGGAGNDVLTVAGDFADYERSRPAATDLLLVNRASGESITLRNVETVEFADGGIAVADLLTALGSPGNDTLAGTAGDDVLDGGAGIDVLAGGQGNDRYVVNVAGDVVTELADGGTDAVAIDFTAKGRYVLGDNVENGTIVSAAKVAVDLSGNALDNYLTGNGAANVLAGGAGADVLTGGAGKDIFVLDSADGVDTVTDFASGADKLRVSQAAFRVGDGDAKLEDAVVRNAPGGFAPKAELVIFGTNVAGELDAAKAAAAIGSASAAYAAGASSLFVVDNGSDSAVFLFASDGDDAAVSAGELTEIVRLVGTSSTVLADFTFAA